jgi:membrane associated rhomboid family serine protease
MNKKTFLAIIIPALICIAVFLFPSSWQEALAFNSLKINLWGWFTFIFTHQNLKHLLFNIIVYLLAMFTGYFILPKDDRKKFPLFVLVLIVFSTIFIFLLEMMFRGLHILPDVLNQRGFSGITASSLGFLCFALSRRIQIRIGNNTFYGLLNFVYFFLLPCLAIIVWNLSIKFSVVLLILWAVITLLFTILNIKKNKKNIKFKKLSKKEIIVLGIAMLILFTGVNLLVPAKVNVDGTFVDILAHFVGFISGLIISFIFFYKNK